MKYTILIIIIFFAALLLVSCGGNLAEASGLQSVPLTVEGADTFQFTPSQTTVPAGTEVILTFKNVGHLDHNFLIVAGDIDPFTITAADALNGITTGIVPGVDETTVTFTAPAPGTYTFVCSVPGHAAAGMVGTLNVVEP